MPLAAAKRELYEETGAVDYDIFPLWDFQAFNEDGTLRSNGRTYFANIRSFEKLPECSEMERVDFFEEPPENVTDRREKMQNAFEKAEKLAMAHYI
jgi:8-oxo-dGTP diphosphatase